MQSHHRIFLSNAQSCQGRSQILFLYRSAEGYFLVRCQLFLHDLFTSAFSIYFHPGHAERMEHGRPAVAACLGWGPRADPGANRARLRQAQNCDPGLWPCRASVLCVHDAYSGMGPCRLVLLRMRAMRGTVIYLAIAPYAVSVLCPCYVRGPSTTRPGGCACAVTV